MRFDAKTAAKIKEIRVAKDQAVANEDYDQAKRLKQMEEQLKSVGLQLSRLETQKREAVANEDYDLAKKIKQEIGMLEASSGAGDRIAQVALSAFGLIDRMVSFGSRVRRDDMCRIIGNSMMQLVNKLGESQAKVRDEAAAVLGRLATAKNVGVAFVTSHLTKRAKKPLGLKLLQGRLLVLKRLLTEFELLPDTDFSVSGIMSFLEDCNCLAHQSREIRDAAKDITVSLYLIVGAEVEGYLKSLRPKQLEEYQSAFEAAETEAAAARRGGGGGGGVSANKNVVRRVESPQKVQAQFNGEQEDDGDSEDEESVDEYTCPFCGVVDEKFDSDYLDQHFWASCKMLTPCKMCGQVIEISTLNEHLLTECYNVQHNGEVKSWSCVNDGSKS
ncbi:hypothetical protein BBJ29_006187 [Phytophthora kernoviae]|uniref:TOG domain-containing protein n=1 Tax=Phytophthora kernoviae TaxID=325452 RepID=A0A3F2RUV0_9STRA|nr:hypothetical protein BBJ29_006187 [Phytophthora kernoviae]RLN64688.1 hypothetical protein BBP00_00003292 [Phytophthora kernoviae]